MKHPEVKFKDWNCIVVLDKYTSNDRTAILLLEKETGDNIAVASINLPKYDLKDDEVIIKNYSENEGILEVLIEAKIISEPSVMIQTGFVKCPVCKLLIKQND